MNIGLYQTHLKRKLLLSETFSSQGATSYRDNIQTAKSDATHITLQLFYRTDIIE